MAKEPASSKTASRKSSAKRVAAPRYTTIDVAVRSGIAVVTLNRPDVHNAFNETLIAELTAALRGLGVDAAVRAVVLIGAGSSFCAGADLNWMKKMAGFSRAQNLADAKAMAAMLMTLNELPKPTIARVHGAAFGTPDAVFALSEARLGLIPATISPYIVEAIGTRAARRLFLTGERFTAEEAFRLGLLHEVTHPAELDERIDDVLGLLVKAGPVAQAECKTLLRAVAQRPIDADLIAETAERIARVRASAEGKEGVAAFLAKRSAAWVPRGE